MTDTPAPLPTTQTTLSAQGLTPSIAPSPVLRNDVATKTTETAEEEPYTIKCICNFSGDDGNTIYCETCDTWQHIDCFYPNNREEAISEDFAHSCADCKPRPLDRQRAIERTLRLKPKNAVVKDEPADKKTKRPPSKSHKKKAKPADLQTNVLHGAADAGKHASPGEPPSASKKPKTSHRPSHSIDSQHAKRSPSYSISRPGLANPPSPATTPPDLPDDFHIHHYSAGFCSLYSEQGIPDTHNNAFANLAIPTALSKWLRDPDTMKQEVGRTHVEVFQSPPANIDGNKPRLEVQDSTRSLNPATTLRWRFVRSMDSIDKDVPIVELNGEIGFQKDYCVDADNLWADLSSPLPFVFFHPVLPLYIDTRKEGSVARYVRRSCKPNAQLDTYLSDGSEYHFWLVSDRYISASEQITLPWDFRLEKSVHSRWLHLLGLSDDDAGAQDEPDLDKSEYTAISNWIDRILSEYGGCACDLDNNCAFARFHRHYLFGKGQARSTKKKSRKSRNRTISPTSTSHASNSRAASEGQGNENVEAEAKNEAGSSRSKPPSRDRTPLQGHFDQLGILTEPTDRDKRKFAMVEDSFRRMEQQQPPRKKKRVSDGAVPATLAKTPKSRTGSAAPPGRYADAGTSSRSKSGSPATSQSPSFANFAIPPPFASPQPSATSGGFGVARSTYRDASVQTESVTGQWFSEPCRSQTPRRRIVSLPKRLLQSRLRNQMSETDSQRRNTTEQVLSDTAGTEAGSPPEQKPQKPPATSPSMASPTPQPGDAIPSETAPSEPKENVPTSAALPSATEAPVTAVTPGTSTTPKFKSPDLRVQVPPVPAFNSSGTGTTPLSSSSTTIHSPMIGGLPSPFVPQTASVVAVNPSPIKKKLSLSDYTKSRKNKTVAKVAGASVVVKPGLASPEEAKGEVSAENEKVDDSKSSFVPTPTVHGA